MRRRKIDDSEIITAIIQTPTIREASELCKVSQATIYARFRDGDFLERLSEERSKILNYATFRVQSLINEQLDIISSISREESNSPQVRLNASETILRYGIKLTEQRDILDRIEQLERVIKTIKGE